MLKVELTKKLHQLQRREATLIRSNKPSMVSAVRVQIEEVNAALFGISVWRFNKYRERLSVQCEGSKTAADIGSGEKILIG